MNMARPIKPTRTNVNVFQSYILTTSHYRFSADEKRILYRLVEIAQEEIKGIKIKDHLYRVYKQPHLFENEFDEELFEFPISSFFADGNGTNHYDRIKCAFRALANKTIEWDDVEEGIWRLSHIISKVEIRRNSGVVWFSVSKWFWTSILDFTKGYRKYELLTAMKLKSPYSMRFYELMAGQKKPYTLTVEQMREMFALDGKYVRPSSIMERVIRPAKEELDACAPYSFDVVAERSGTGKTSPITAFKFIPVFREENQDAEIMRKEHTAKETTRNTFGNSEIYDLFSNVYGYSYKEISSLKQIVNRAIDVMGKSVFIDFLKSIKDDYNYQKAEEPQKYLVGMIKNKTKDVLELQQPKPGEPIKITKNQKYKRW